MTFASLDIRRRVISIAVTSLFYSNLAHASQTPQSHCDAGYKNLVFYYTPKDSAEQKVLDEIPSGADLLMMHINLLKPYCSIDSIVIEGHASRPLDNQEAIKQSKARATELRELLVSKGISDKLIQPVYYGLSRPRIRDIEIDKFNQLNSRVEVKILLSSKNITQSSETK